MKSRRAKKKEPEKRGRGRPTKYDPRFCRIATDLARLGLIKKQIAESFDVNTDTLYAWCEQYPEFAEALKAGGAPADANVARSLYERACGYSHPAEKIFLDEGKPVKVEYTQHYPPDPVCCIFWLRNRRPDLWRNNPNPEDSEPAPAPVKIDVAVVDARKRRSNADA